MIMIKCRGVYIKEETTTPAPPPGDIIQVIWGENCENEKEEKRKMCKK
jgi:hypothetical protein